MSKKDPKMPSVDIEFVKKEIEAWRDGQRRVWVTRALIEKSIGFSRQTMFAKTETAVLHQAAKKTV